MFSPLKRKLFQRGQNGNADYGIVGKPTAWQTKEPEETKVERLDALIATKYTVDETKCFVRGVRDEEVTAPEVTQQLELERTLSEMSLAKEEVEIELVDEDSDDMPQEEEFLVAEYVSTYP